MAAEREPGPPILEQPPPMRDAPGFEGHVVIGDRVLPRRQADTHQQRLMVEHVLYEIEQVAGLLRACIRDASTEARTLARGTRSYIHGQALVTSYLLHVRTLDDFLYRDQLIDPLVIHRGAPEFGSYAERPWLRRPDDVLAIDLVEDPRRWIGARPHRSTALAEVRTRINKAVIHLDWARVDPNAWLPGHNASIKEQTYDPNAPYVALREALQVFLECVPETLGPILVEPAIAALDGPAGLPD
jgi:hypothetical protein